MVIVHTRGSTIFSHLFVCLAMALLAQGASAEAQAEPESKDCADNSKELRSLLKQRSDVLNDAVNLLMALFTGGLTDLQQLYQAQQDALKATLELEESTENRIAMLKEQQQMAQQIMRVAEARFKGGTVRDVDVRQAKVLYLDAQIARLREEQKLRAMRSTTTSDCPCPCELNAPVYVPRRLLGR